MSLDAILNIYTINYDPSLGGRQTLKPFEQKKQDTCTIQVQAKGRRIFRAREDIVLEFSNNEEFLVFEHIFQLIQSLNSAGTPADSIFKRGWVTSRFSL